MQTAEQAAFVVSSGRTADRVKDLERIISLKQDWLFRFAYLRVGSREDAEDIVQDVLLRLYRSKEQLTNVE